MISLSYYAERNGLAKYWERLDIGQNVSYWAQHHPQEVYCHPEVFQELVNKLLQYDIDLFHSTTGKNKYNISVYADSIDSITDNEVDNITGVDLNG